VREGWSLCAVVRGLARGVCFTTLRGVGLGEEIELVVAGD
jgi:hypothetical protein